MWLAFPAPPQEPGFFIYPSRLSSAGRENTNTHYSSAQVPTGAYRSNNPSGRVLRRNFSHPIRMHAGSQNTWTLSKSHIIRLITKISTRPWTVLKCLCCFSCCNLASQNIQTLHCKLGSDAPWTFLSFYVFTFPELFLLLFYSLQLSAKTILLLRSHLQEPICAEERPSETYTRIFIYSFCSRKVNILRFDKEHKLFNIFF